MSLDVKFAQLARLELKEQILQITSLSDEVLASGSVPLLRTFSQKVLAEDVPVQAAKAALIRLSKGIRSLPDDVFYEIACFLVSSIKQSPAAQSFDEADFNIRDALFTYCVSCEEYIEAAQFLSGANFDSSTRTFTEVEKVDIYIKCAGKNSGTVGSLHVTSEHNN